MRVWRIDFIRAFINTLLSYEKHIQYLIQQIYLTDFLQEIKNLDLSNFIMTTITWINLYIAQIHILKHQSVYKIIIIISNMKCL